MQDRRAPSASCSIPSIVVIPLPGEFVRKDEAGERRSLVDEDGAGPAVAGPAPLLRALESETPSQGVEEALLVGNHLAIATDGH